MIIGISGKIGSGKDTVATIINCLLYKDKRHIDGSEKSVKAVLNYQSHYGKVTDFSKVPFQDVQLAINMPTPSFEIKRYADKLKDMVCMLIGCTREQLEDRVFKETVLGEEWWYIDVLDDEDNLENRFPYSAKLWAEWDNNEWYHTELVKLTPRRLMQLVGTDCGRDILHPNVWVNALMSEYKLKFKNPCPQCGDTLRVQYQGGCMRPDCYKGQKGFRPQWIITDVRFPNEVEAIEKRDGFVIRLNRENYLLEDGMHKWFDDKDIGHLTMANIETHTKEQALVRYRQNRDEGAHESETALDSHTFTETINNNGSLQDLITKVREVLIKREIIHV